MTAHGRSRVRLFGVGAAGVMALAAIAGCSGGSSGSSAPSPASSASPGPTAPAADAPSATDPDAASADPLASADKPAVTQSGPGDRKVTAVLQPPGSATAAQFAQLTQLVKARAALIAGTVVSVTSTSGSITVVGDTTQADAIRAIGRQVTVTLRPVLAVAGTDGNATLPNPSASAEADAENVFEAVDCTDPNTLPAPAAADQYGVGCTNSGTKLLLGPAGAVGTDVSGATAKNGQSGWEVDVTFTARGSQGLSTLSGSMAANNGTMALEWDDMVPVATTVSAPITSGGLQISGLSQGTAEELAAILGVGASGATLNVSSVAVAS